MCKALSRVILSILSVGFFSISSVHAALDAAAILTASDMIRNPSQPFSIAVNLTEYKDNKSTDSTSLIVYSKAEKETGQYRSLVRYLAPLRDSGKLMLKNGNDMWFYDPNSKASVRISPQQRLLGQAANGDVVTVNFAKDYYPVLHGEEMIRDGEQHERTCFKLNLSAAAADVTYDHIEMWVDSKTNGPVKGKFYSESGALLKTVYYRKYRQELGVERPTEIVIIDGLNPKWVTVMRYSQYRYREIPDAWYQRDYLARFVGE